MDDTTTPVTAEGDRPTTDLQREIEHARAKLAEYEAGRVTSDPHGSGENVFVRYGYLMRLLQMLVDAYDTERAKGVTR